MKIKENYHAQKENMVNAHFKPKSIVKNSKFHKLQEIIDSTESLKLDQS